MQKNKDEKMLEVVAHTFNPSTWEAEAGKFLNLRPAWSTK
jgi:major histocompatibility complex class I